MSSLRTNCELRCYEDDTPDLLNYVNISPGIQPHQMFCYRPNSTRPDTVVLIVDSSISLWFYASVSPVACSMMSLTSRNPSFPSQIQYCAVSHCESMRFHVTKKLGRVFSAGAVQGWGFPALWYAPPVSVQHDSMRNTAVCPSFWPVGTGVYISQEFLWVSSGPGKGHCTVMQILSTMWLL